MAMNKSPSENPANAAIRGKSEDPILQVKNLTKEFELSKTGFLQQKPKMLRAVDTVSFDIKRGESFGLVGESGCGKSTLARCILRLIKPSSGQVFFNGVELSSLSQEEMRPYRQKMQIVFQDPYSSLDPRMTALQIVEEPLIIHGLDDREQRLQKAREILDLVGITPEQVDRRPDAFSGGQRQRIGIARALILDPEFVVLDEPVSALDVSIQAQVLNLLRSIQERLQLTYLFIVHDLILAEYFCDRLAVLYLGAVMEMADRETLFNSPQHPYTVTLLSAVPVPDPFSKSKLNRIILEGEVDPLNVQAGGCRFRSRCPIGKDKDICRDEEPLLEEKASGHWVSCHFPGELELSETH